MLILDAKPLTVEPGASLRTVIAAIDRGELQIVLVVDPDGRLLGTISDGDVRRGLLRGVTLEDEARAVMNCRPLTVAPDANGAAVDALMLRTHLRRLPVVDADGVLRGLAVPSVDATHVGLRERVVVMAGGLGSRLAPLTHDTPKPLLRVGSKPILETILEGFVSQGFTDFTFSVNYRADMIMEYFGDGARWGVSIDYVRETRALGTAGSLTLLPERPTVPVIVMNGDLLTKVDFRKLLDFHAGGGHTATMTVREHALPIPYGVVDVRAQRLVELVEKPIKRFFINAGIYVLEPSCIDFVPSDTHFDMTDLFARLLEQGYPLGAFPIHEYWQDIGQPNDLQRANDDYVELWNATDVVGQEMEGGLADR